MAEPTTASWTALTFWLGDAESPETFTSKVCGFTTKSFEINTPSSDTPVPDCNDPDLPASIERVIKSLDAGFKGSGLAAAEVYEAYVDWQFSGQPRNGYVVVEGLPNMYFSAAFVIANTQLSGSMDDGKAKFSCDIKSTGKVTKHTGLPA